MVQTSPGLGKTINIIFNMEKRRGKRRDDRRTNPVDAKPKTREGKRRTGGKTLSIPRHTFAPKDRRLGSSKLHQEDNAHTTRQGGPYRGKFKPPREITLGLIDPTRSRQSLQLAQPLTALAGQPKQTHRQGVSSV